MPLYAEVAPSIPTQNGPESRSLNHMDLRRACSLWRSQTRPEMLIDKEHHRPRGPRSTCKHSLRMTGFCGLNACLIFALHACTLR
jgi:hypothetical protein